MIREMGAYKKRYEDEIQELSTGVMVREQEVLMLQSKLNSSNLSLGTADYQKENEIAYLKS